MNKAYRLIWSRVKEAWVIVSENVAGKGGPLPVACSLLAAFTLAAGSASALPTGPQVVSGTVGINTVGSTMTITNSPSAIINWQGFSIAANEATHFIQQSANSSVLNRVIGGNSSQIYGTLQSNGRVFLINQNGILFGPNAVINVNGLVASTLNITNEDFLAGRMKFTADLLAGKVENQGSITTPNGGSVYLIAPDVENSGVITAPNGDILLAAGKEVLLVDRDSPEIAAVVTAPDGQALNLGTLAADAGRIGVYGTIVKQMGVVSANSAVQDASGRIFLKATKQATLASGSSTTANGPTGGSITVQATEGTTLVSGTIEATGDVGTGGNVQLLGQQVGLIDNANIDVSGTAGGGTVLVGGDYQGRALSGVEGEIIPNAQATYMGKDTLIKADALENGNGGKVILWADDVTRAYGSISAKGGATGGDGGFVEVSGKNYLDFNAYINTLAPFGKAGMLLLDPTNIWIALNQGNATAAGMVGTDNSADISASSIFATGAVNDSFLSTGNLYNALQTSSVTVSTTNASGGGAGNITLVDPLTGLSNMGVYTLTLQADNNININAEISGSSVAPAIVMNAGGALSINANITVDNSVDLTANTINIGNTANSAINITGGGFTSVSQAGFNLGTGAFTGSVSATTVVSVYNQASGGINIGANGTLDSNNASLNFTEMKGGASFSGSINAGTGVITMVSDSSGTVSQASGTITSAGLKLQGTGSFSLLGANAVTTLAGNPTGAGGISFKNSGLLTVDTVGANTTLQSAGDITLITTSGNISILKPVTSSGEVTLQSAGTITQAESITGTVLSTSSVGGTTLNHTSNAVTSFSATNATSGAIALVNTAANLTLNGLNVVNNAANGNISISNTGALTTVGWVQTTGNGNISLMATNGTATIGNSLITGTDNTSTGSVSVTSTGAASDIVLNNINVYSGSTGGGSGSISLNAGRDIKLTPAAVVTTADVTLQAGRTIQIDAPGSITAGSAYLNAAAGGTIGGTGAINAPTIELQYLSGTSQLGLSSASPLLTSGANSTITFGMSGTGPSAVYLSHTGNLSFSSFNYTAPNAPIEIAASGNLAAPALNTGTANLTLKSIGGALSLGGGLSGANIFLQNGSGEFLLEEAISATGNVQLTSSGAVSDTGDASITATGLAILAGGDISLSTGAYTVTKLAALTTGGNVLFRNSADLNIDDVGGLVGINSGNGNVDLYSNGGDIWITKPVNAGTGSVYLSADGGIYTGSGGSVNVVGSSFAASAVSNIGGAVYSLLTQVSQWGNIAAGGDVYLENVGGVTTTGTVTSSGGSVMLKANSPLTIGTGGVDATNNIALTAAASGGSDDLTLNGPLSAGGNISLTAGSQIFENSTISAGGTVTRAANLNTATTPTETPVIPPSLEPQPPDGLVLVAQVPAVEEDDKDEDKDGDTNDQGQQQGGDNNDEKPKKNYCP